MRRCRGAANEFSQLLPPDDPVAAARGRNQVAEEFSLGEGWEAFESAPHVYSQPEAIRSYIFVTVS